MEQTETVHIVRIDDSGQREQEDLVVEEFALTINLNDRQLATMLCTPSDLEVLGLGFLLSEGIVSSMKDVESYSLSDDRSEFRIYVKGDMPLVEELRKRIITSGCGRGSIFYNVLDSPNLQMVSSDVRITAGSITQLANDIQSASKLFKSTGGVHVAALCDTSSILVFKEDIGRHNAIDKVLGECLVRDIDFDGKMLLTSGRISSEMLLKAVRCGVAVVASRSAPTSMAVQFAQKTGITLAGFVRGRRMNLYSNAYRIEV